MMTVDVDVIVVGGGCAGVAAACCIAESGRSVMLCDQAPSLGGAIHRKVAEECGALLVSKDLITGWRDLKSRLDQQSDHVEIRVSTIFVGLDSTGVAVIKDHITNSAQYVAPKAMVFATGAYENIKPVPGWHYPGVTTAGALQVHMKSAGTPPKGKVLLAGSGPLLLAIAAQLTVLGNAPVAVVESARPLLKSRHWLGLPLPFFREAFSYVTTLWARRVPWICGADVELIERTEKGLAVTVSNGKREVNYDVDIVGLHNGLRENNIGLPAENLDPADGVLVVHAGDCHAVLGARAASQSGSVAAGRLLTAMGDPHAELSCSPALESHTQSQAKLAAIFSPVRPLSLENLPDETILCRCEQKSIGDLREMLVTRGVSAREIKLNGRFGMGRCQGRFCGKWVLDLLDEINGEPRKMEELSGRRWPVRPISIGSLTGLGQQQDVRKLTQTQSGD